TGDFDGDLDFTTSDLVRALQTGAYEKGPRSAVAAVPEPTSLVLLTMGGLLLLGRRSTRA
ncbi:MAG: PEP-CTERM sorting domain-containing protein, partial [Planctomycetales bacterium]|nr:PEP-CTERM sorting domain-containing protein [Planctomycetales bacterium]